MQADSTKVLAVTVVIFFFTSNLSSTFLPIYLKDSGLSLPEIMVVMLFAFIVIGLLPPALLKATKHFERILSFGVFSTTLFYLALIYVKNPILLGLAYGLSIATFWPSFNLLLFRLSDADKRATIISLFSVTIPSITCDTGLYQQLDTCGQETTWTFFDLFIHVDISLYICAGTVSTSNPISESATRILHTQPSQHAYFRAAQPAAFYLRIIWVNCSGLKGCRSSYACPTPMNRIGLPVT